jgi:hypothetical protein
MFLIEIIIIMFNDIGISGVLPRNRVVVSSACSLRFLDIFSALEVGQFMETMRTAFAQCPASHTTRFCLLDLSCTAFTCAVGNRLCRIANLSRG